MTTIDLKKTLKTKFPFNKEGFVKENFTIYHGNEKITMLNYLKIKNKNLGFQIERLLDCSGSNELIYVTGTNTKDGVYFLDHERELITVEELETNDDVEDFVEDVIGKSIDKYSKLTPDEKLSLFIKHCELIKKAHTLEAFIEQLKFTENKK